MPKNKHLAALKPCFRASAKSGVLEILIYEEIGYDFWTGGGITAANIREEMDRAGNFDSISVRINSPGGDAFEGIAIGNVLRATGKPINVAVDGIAASAASIIAMCGSSIVMAKNAMMMIHNAWSMCMGEASDMRKMADTLDKISASIAQTYVEKTGKSDEEIKTLMDAETWLNAEECVAQGFATAIAEGNEPAIAMARGFKILSKLKSIPDSLKASTKADMEDSCNCDCAACMAGDCPGCTNPDCADVNCEDCPMQSVDNQAPVQPSNLSLQEARFAAARLGITV